MLPAVGYVRISDDKQVGNTSIDTQKELIGNWANQLGYDIIDFCVDEAVSAYHTRPTRRKAVVDLVNYLHSGSCLAVIFYDESRLDRQFSPWVREVFKPAKEINPLIKFFHVGSDKEWDPWDPEVIMRLLFARTESVTKSARAIDTQSAMLDGLEHPGSRPPYGYSYDTDRRKLVPNQQSDVVYLVFYLASWGHASDRIADTLNRLDVRPSKSHQWNPSSIDAILSNSTYVGQVYWSKSAANESASYKQLTLYENLVSPIIPEYLWEIVQSVRKLKKENKRALSTPNLLLGQAECGSCGNKLKVRDQSPSKAKGKYVNYYCTTCNARFPAEELNSKVVEHFLNEWLCDTSVQVKEIKDELDGWRQLLENEKSHLSSQLQQLQLKKSMCTADVPYFKEWMNAISAVETVKEQEIGSLSALIEQVTHLAKQDNVERTFRHFRKSAMEQFNLVELRTLCLMAINKVVVTTDGAISIEYKLMPLLDVKHRWAKNRTGSKFLGKEPNTG